MGGGENGVLNTVCELLERKGISVCMPYPVSVSAVKRREIEVVPRVY